MAVVSASLGAAPVLSLRWRIMLVSLGIWMAVCGGTLYAFSAFEVELMEKCQLSARQLDTVYAFGQLGVGLGIIAGVLHDRFGPAVTLVYACVMTLIGNLGLHAAIHSPQCNGMGTLAVLYFALQNGSTAIYQCGLFTNIRCAPAHAQGATAGIVAAGYGLSAAIAAAAYSKIFARDLARYLHGCAVTFAVTALFGAMALPWFLRDPSKSYAHLEEPEEGKSAQAPSVIGKAEERSYAHLEERGEGKQQVQRHNRRVPAPLGKEVEEASPNSRSPPSPSKAKTEQISLGTVVSSPDFWGFVLTFAQLQAVGSGVFIANLGLMAHSLGMADGSRTMAVRLVSYCNCFGRFAAGCIIDYAEVRGVPRVVHTVWSGFILVFAALILRFTPAESLPALIFPLLAMVGFSYGSNWTIMPSFIAQRFQNSHVGVCFNLNACLMSVTVVGISSVVGGLYDAAAVSSGSGQKGFCKGAQCWRGAFALGVGLSATGFLSALLLSRFARRPSGPSPEEKAAAH